MLLATGHAPPSPPHPTLPLLPSPPAARRWLRRDYGMTCRSTAPRSRSQRGEVMFAIPKQRYDSSFVVDTRFDVRLEIVKKLFDNKLMIIHRLIHGSIASVLIINSLSSLDAWWYSCIRFAVARLGDLRMKLITIVSMWLFREWGEKFNLGSNKRDKFEARSTRYRSLSQRTGRRLARNRGINPRLTALLPWFSRKINVIYLYARARKGKIDGHVSKKARLATRKSRRRDIYRARARGKRTLIERNCWCKGDTADPPPLRPTCITNYVTTCRRGRCHNKRRRM